MIDFNKIDVMIVTSRENIRHITGFTGSAGIAILYPDKKYLLTDFRYKEQSAIEVRDAEVIIISKKYTFCQKFCIYSSLLLLLEVSNN